LHKIVSSLLVYFISQMCSALEFGGEIKLQQVLARTKGHSLQASLGVQDYSLHRSNMRLLLDHQESRWSFDLDYLLTLDYSDDLSPLKLTTSPFATDNNYFDWQSTIDESDSSELIHLIDRGSIKYSADQWVIKIGRQALTWGNGVVFHPMDLFNPFSPNAKDTSYKPGIDAAYGQYLFENGDDLQWFYVPGNDELFADDSHSVAAKYLKFFDGKQFEILVAENHGLNVLGFGFSGPIGDAIWKFDLVSGEREFDSSAFSFDLNLHYSWMWGERPVSGFIEFYQNGYADNSIQNLTQLSMDLMRRLERGQTFTLGKNNLAFGAQIQWSPLVIVSANLIRQLNDSSSLLLATLTFNLSQSSNLIAGLQLTEGSDGTEYGGYYVDDNQQVIADPGNQIYLRYEWYF